MALRKHPVVVDIPLEIETTSESRSFFPKIPTRSNLVRKSVESDRPDGGTDGALNCDMATLTLFDQNHERVSFSFLSQRRDLPELHKLLQNAKQSYLIGRRRRLQEPELSIRGACIPTTLDESADWTNDSPRQDGDSDFAGNFQLPLVLPQRSVKAEPKRRARRAHRLGVPRYLDEQRNFVPKLPRIRPDSMNVTGNGFPRWDSMQPSLGDKAKTNLHLNNRTVVGATTPSDLARLPAVKFEDAPASKQATDFIQICQPISSSTIKHVPNDDLPLSVRNNTPVSILANETQRIALDE